MASHKSSGSGVLPVIPKQASRSRRTTCDICRERKVRCDKEQPTCERCRRLNLKCTYTPPRDSLDVSQALLQLHERLAQAEAALATANAANAAHANSNPITHATPTPPPVTSQAQAPPQSHGTQVPVSSWDPVPSPSTGSMMLGLNDPNFGYFPSIEDNFMSQDFTGSWPQNTDALGAGSAMTGITVPGNPLFVDTSVEGPDGSLKMPYASIPHNSAPKTQNQMPTPVWSSPSSGFRTPYSSSTDCGPNSVGPNIISLLHQRYFEATRHVPSIINRERFYRLLNDGPLRHQVNALSHAVAMAGAALSDDFPHLESLCYYSARHFVEQAERQEDGSNFMNLELLQALLLIVRYEFNEARCSATAWMTHGKAIRLLKLLCLERIDADHMPLAPEFLRLPLPPSTPAEMDERRRTLWVAFNMDFFIAAMTNTLPSLQTDEIFTYLPTADAISNESDNAFPGVLLRDALTHAKNNTISIFSPLIIATALGNQALKHLKMSADSTTEYDFWTHHFTLDKTLVEYLSLSPFSQQGPGASDDALLATTHLTLLGVVIMIHMKAFERALQTGFPDSLAMESRSRFEKAAMEIAEAFQQGGAFSRVNLKVCNHISMYLMWPVSLATRVQLLRLKDPIGSADPGLQMSQQGVAASVRILESALRALKGATTLFDDLFEQIRSIMDRRGSTTPGGGGLEGRHRTASSSSTSLNGFIF